MKLLLLLPVILVLLFASTSIAFAQESLISVHTDKASYSEGEIILITGQVGQILEGIKISFTVIGPNGNIVFIEQIRVEEDKTFGAFMAAGGALMKIEGTYTMTVQYGSNNSATITFYFEGSTTTPPSEVSTITDTDVYIRGTNEKIGFSGLKSIIVSIVPDVDASSLIIVLNVREDTTLTLDIPRIALDSTENGRDTTFFVLIDGQNTVYNEIKSSTHRKLMIPLVVGNEEMEIIGTEIFGSSLPEACVGCSMDEAREKANQLNKNISVHTDKSSYSKGEIIHVTGKVTQHLVGYAASFTVIAPNGNTIALKQLSVREGEFSTSIPAGAALMKAKGTYTVIIRYGDNKVNSATTTFEFSGSTATPPSNSKCGPGTVFDRDFNSCVLIPDKKHLDNNPINENIPLQEKNTQLKLENKQLKNKINELQLKIVNLQNIIHEQIKVMMDILVDFKSNYNR